MKAAVSGDRSRLFLALDSGDAVPQRLRCVAVDGGEVTETALPTPRHNVNVIAADGSGEHAVVGSAGGHNGLESIIQNFGTEAVPRMRVGIGAPEQRDAVDHVLGKFAPEEVPQLESAVIRALDAIAMAQRDGFTAAMNAFNRSDA